MNLSLIAKSMLATAIYMAANTAAAADDGLLQYVDPYIGTAGHGHTFLGVSAPFGAVQLGPSNFYKGWDWSSGYHYSDSIVAGFAHLHLNGTGCSDTGDLMFMPYTGNANPNPGSQENPDTGYASRYSHKNEIARPGYYSLILDDSGIKAELTSSERVGVHRYTYPAGSHEHVMINLKDACGNDRPLDAYIEQTDDFTIRGYRISAGWAKHQEIYFAAVFSQPVKLSIYNNMTPAEGKSLKSPDVKGDITPLKSTGKIMIKVGISPVSMDNAIANIKAEVPGWDFEACVNRTNNLWENELSKIKISTDNAVHKRIFYTGLYHAFIQPNLFNDYNGAYRGADSKEYPPADFDNYTVFSLWDTYRAANPLYTLIQPERVHDFINTFLAIHDQQGMLPVWHLYGSETGEMIGIQSVPVIADAILKDMGGFNYERAYNAMKASMLSDYKGLGFLKNGDYIPADKEKESVAKGLEYAIADWGIAAVAKKLGKKDDSKFFARRATNYKQYWDATTRFFRGKNSDGSWQEPFDPFHSSHRNDAYCEGTAWQYVWLVPHDVKGLIDRFGSKEAFTAKLDSLFTVSGDMGEEASGDISGLIGQYAHGNEPGHHTAYLYAFAGKQWKTAEKVRYILEHMYSDQPYGYQGNEDCGQMSAWYILSSLGFYQVNPSNGVYVFGSPLFDKAEINVGNGKTFTILCTNNTPENIYIDSVTLNGKKYFKSYITHKDILKGGTLVFNMSDKPNKHFGASALTHP